MNRRRHLRRSVLAVGAVICGSFVPAVASAAPAVAVGTAPATTAAPLPRLTVGDVSVAEGNSGKIVVKVPVSLNMPAPSRIVVNWTITGGSATAVQDFIAPKSGVKSGHLAIGMKHTDGFVNVTVRGDTNFELDETVNVDVTAAGVDVVRSQGSVTILNDDPAVAPVRPLAARVSAAALVPTLSIGTPTVWEGDSGGRRVWVPLALSDPAPAPITVTFDVPGSADQGLDQCNSLTSNVTVRHVTATVTFGFGQQSAFVIVTVYGNADVDQTITDVTATATVVSGSVNLAFPTAQIVIVDDDTAAAAIQPGPGTYRVSEPWYGVNPSFPGVVSNPSVGCGYPTSNRPSISADGRYVLFTSNADNLVANDTNGYDDAFVKDTWSGQIQRVSLGSDGTQANGWSRAESISGDGRYVTFMSTADNLVPNDDNQDLDDFLYDRATKTIRRIGDSHGAGVMQSAVSPDGSSVAFIAGPNVLGGCAASRCLGLLDVATNAVTLVSTGANATIPGYPAFSGDGRHLAFNSLDPTGSVEVFVKDLDTGAVEMVSVNNAGAPLTGVWGTYPLTRPALNYDGQLVAFLGQYCNAGLPSIPCGDGTAVRITEIWVRDRATQQTTLESVEGDGTPVRESQDAPSLSADGRYLVFDSGDVTAAPECPQGGPTSGGNHVYERDRTTGVVVRVDVISAAVPCPTSAQLLDNSQSVSADGSTVVYMSLLGPNVSTTNPEAIYVTRLR